MQCGSEILAGFSPECFHIFSNCVIPYPCDGIIYGEKIQIAVSTKFGSISGGTFYADEPEVAAWHFHKIWKYFSAKSRILVVELYMRMSYEVSA